MGIRKVVAMVSFVSAVLAAGLTFFIVCLNDANLRTRVTRHATLHPMTLVGSLCLLFICVLGLCLLVGMWSTKAWRDGLLEMEEASAILGAGHLHYRIDTQLRANEIGRLGHQFNQMSERIETQVQLLQRLADENRMLAQEAEQLGVVEERQRLARELHDSVSQQLFAIGMLASASVRQHETGASQLASTLNQLSTLANLAQREMRALLLHLRPVPLEGRSLKEAATEFLQAIEQRHALTCSIQCFQHGVSTSDDLPVSPAIEDALFRILQEAVANVIKHANAHRVEVGLDWRTDTLVMWVVDDGEGAPDGFTPVEGDRYGVKAMRDRAAALGGQCDIVHSEQGTIVSAIVPIVLRKENP